MGDLERYNNACTKGFDCHVLLPALNLEVQFDPNKFHLALDKKLCLAIKFSGKYQCRNNIFK